MNPEEIKDKFNEHFDDFKKNAHSYYNKYLPLLMEYLNINTEVLGKYFDKAKSMTDGVNKEQYLNTLFTYLKNMLQIMINYMADIFQTSTLSKKYYLKGGFVNNNKAYTFERPLVVENPLAEQKGIPMDGDGFVDGVINIYIQFISKMGGKTVVEQKETHKYKIVKTDKNITIELVDFDSNEVVAESGETVTERLLQNATLTHHVENGELVFYLKGDIRGTDGCKDKVKIGGDVMLKFIN